MVLFVSSHGLTSFASISDQKSSTHNELIAHPAVRIDKILKNTLGQENNHENEPDIEDST